MERGASGWIAPLAAAIMLAVTAPEVRGQAGSSATSEPAEALASALARACRQDADGFAGYLTAPNAAAFRGLPAAQRTGVMQRFVLQETPGAPLLSTGAEGRTVLRCQAGGRVTEMRFGETERQDNLAFIPVEVPQASQEAGPVRFGLVREHDGWRLLSVGLLLLDVPAMARQWEAGEMAARESRAVAALREIAEALQRYQRAYGRLPESLEALGPPGAGGFSPERAGLLDAQLAAGSNTEYRFRYSIAPAGGSGGHSDREKAAGFQLAATPEEYGRTGRRSYYLDATGVLRGADKQGAVATAEDPRIDETGP